MRNSIPDFFELTHGGSAHINSEILGGNQRVVRLGLTKTGKADVLNRDGDLLSESPEEKLEVPGGQITPHPPTSRETIPQVPNFFLQVGRSRKFKFSAHN